MKTGLVLMACLMVTASHAQDRRPAALAEGWVDFGGYRLHLAEAGSGRIPVIFVAGMGESLDTWSKTQPEIALFARTLSYDRGGLGRSDPDTGPRDIRSLANELHALLEATGIPPPFVLVGHSLGGAIVQVFAGTYPSEVAGMVLLDPEDGRLLDMLRARMSKEAWAARRAALATVLPTFTAAQRAEQEALEASGSAVSHSAPWPAVPVVLFTGTKKNPAFPGNPLEQDTKLEIHRSDLAKMPDAIHVLVPGSRHYIQNDAPDLVIEAVRNVIAKVRAPTQ